MTGDVSYDGPPITSVTKTGTYGTAYAITVYAYSEAGESPGLQMSGSTGAPPMVLELRQAPNPNTTSGGCTPQAPCYRAEVTVRNYGGGAACTLSAPADPNDPDYQDYTYSWTQADNTTRTAGSSMGIATSFEVTVTCRGPSGEKTVSKKWVKE